MAMVAADQQAQLKEMADSLTTAWSELYPKHQNQLVIPMPWDSGQSTTWTLLLLLNIIIGSQLAFSSWPCHQRQHWAL